MRILIAAVLLTVLSNATAHADDSSLAQILKQRPISVTVYDWEPYSGKNLPGYGLATKITTEALRDNGLEVDYALVPWIRALTVTKRGGYDVIPGLWYTDERNRDFAFSEPFLSNDLVTISLASDPRDYNEPEDLKGRHVALVRGYTYPDYLQEQQGAHFELGVSLGANLKKLLFKRVDVVIGDRIAAKWLANRMFGKAARFLKYAEKPLVSRGLFIGVSRKSELSKPLIEALDRKIIQWKKDGTLARLIREYSLSPAEQPPLELDNLERIEELHSALPAQE